MYVYNIAICFGPLPLSHASFRHFLDLLCACGLVATLNLCIGKHLHVYVCMYA